MADKKRDHLYLGVGLLLLRLWQWVSSLAIYISFSMLYQYISSRKLGENARMKDIERLGMASALYATFILATVHLFRGLKVPMWTAFAIASVPGDLLMLGLFVAKITMLSLAGLPADCHGMTRDDYIPDYDLLRQPGDGFTTIRFGSTRSSVGELDKFCIVPQGAYSLSVIAVYSYTLSVLFTVLVLHRHRYPLAMDEKAASVEVAGPEPMAPRSSLESNASPDVEERLPAATIFCGQEAGPSSPAAHLLCAYAQPSSSRVEPKTTVGVKLDIISERQDTFADVPLGRVSVETTSSFNPENYLVCDGARRPENPPAYTSRPSSLYTVDL